MVSRILILALAGSASSIGRAEEAPCQPPVAQLVSAFGQVDAQWARQAVWRPAVLHQGYCVEDRVKTGEFSRAVLAMLEGIATRLSLNQNTLVNFQTVADRVILSVDYGDVHVRSHTPRHFDVTTPFVNAGIEGTEFLISSHGNQAEVSVFEGTVQLSNPQGKLTLAKGQTALVEQGQPPRVKLRLHPGDAVQWALYYPPIIDTGTLLRQVSDPALRRSIDQYRAGRIAAALDELNQAVEIVKTTADYRGYRAGLLLTVGQAETAQPLLRQALKENPRDAIANSLLAIVALAEGQKEQALELATTATRDAPRSPVPLLALSYAEQARFKLETALDAVEAALRLDPENALLHTRHAELLASLGERTAARSAAERATHFNPQLGHAHTVLGFTQLMDGDTADAQRSFHEAISRDSFDPLARFGLGLAKIREGRLEAGTEDLEIAGNLDPNDSLIRSYLGKAYYEQKRNDLAQVQVDLAKHYDPNDPTPYFYDAIKKQADNRPGEALQDLQHAIDRNDKRAIYRSKQQLDSDLAARSSSLARIYNDLGFGSRALFEGWRSLITDPSDYSSHRFLADSYANLPRHEIVRVSELLQSQLLQPLNITPLQPHLAESNLPFFSAFGPSTLSFTEFNPLFQRNRHTVQASGYFGSNYTFGDEITLSGISDSVSYSLGQFRYTTDGFRKNNDLSNNIYSAFIQKQLTPEWSVQAEIRHKELEHGDIAFNFDLDNPDTFYRRTLRSSVYRAGAHWNPSTGHNLIASFIHQDDLEDSSFGSVSSNGNIVEAQYLFQKNNFNIIAGGGYYDTRRNLDISNRYVITPAHTNGYLYSYWRFPKNLSWTLGLSVDKLDGENDGNFHQVNPKVGILWNITEDTTLRFAYFRSLKRSLLTDQTIEPTQLAGFNQLFDDYIGTDSSRYGLAIDQRFSRSLFAGIEASRRELKRPYDVEDTEQSLRAYVNWMPISRVAATASYDFDDFSRSAAYGSSFMKTHTVSATLKYFDPSGTFLSAGINFIDQSQSLADTPGHDSFSITNVGIGYRLPKRLGIVSLDVNNIFDEKFSFVGYYPYRSPSIHNLPFLPERTILGRITLAF